jgi:hypothetical protein
MARTPKSKRRRVPKTILKLPDLEQSQSAVLNSLTSPSSQRFYDHATHNVMLTIASLLSILFTTIPQHPPSRSSTPY